jgi:hypothetical protein
MKGFGYLGQISALLALIILFGLSVEKISTLGLEHKYRKTKNRLFQVCYLPTTSLGFQDFFFLFFFDAAINSTNEAHKAGRRCH